MRAERAQRRQAGRDRVPGSADGRSARWIRTRQELMRNSSPRNHGSPLEVDLDLWRKYSRPGPRYTSYPTAPRFTDAFGPAEFRDEIVASNRQSSLPELSLYFHFPFCKSLCYYCACNVIITHSKARIAEYLAGLEKEIDLLSGLVNPSRTVVQMHWGGGTPTYLSQEQVRSVFGHLEDRFEFASDAEIAIEIDPRGLSREYLAMLRNIGFNRVSFGIQDFDHKVQESVNRVQPEALNRDVIRWSRDLGFESVNVDLIYGLPRQTVESYEKTLDKVIDIGPDRLAVFNFAHVPWLKKHQVILPTETLPGPREKLRLLKLIIEKLTAAGYVYIGMDHFARPEDELARALRNRSLYRNFQGYSTRADAEVYAMGVTSISQLRNVYAQNTKDTATYAGMLNRGLIPTHVGYRLDEDDQVRRYVITEIMCNSRVVKAEVADKFGVEFDSYFAGPLAKLGEFVGDGLVSLEKDRLEVHEAGRLVIRNIAMAFDRYLGDESCDGKPVFSRTV
jgi:oxygen-independent coproporphyrinogen-3 oxidase